MRDAGAPSAHIDHSNCSTVTNEYSLFSAFAFAACCCCCLLHRNPSGILKNAPRHIHRGRSSHSSGTVAPMAGHLQRPSVSQEQVLRPMCTVCVLWTWTGEPQRAVCFSAHTAVSRAAAFASMVLWGIHFLDDAASGASFCCVFCVKKLEVSFLVSE